MDGLVTERLELFPCSYEIGKLIVENREALKKTVELDISAHWPLEDLRGFLPIYLEQLQSEPTLARWGIWLVVHSGEQKIIGDIGFKGEPDEGGSIEMGYSFVPEYRGKGYCSEAAEKLVEWAFQQPGVNKILAECTVDNTPSINVLKRLHMDIAARTTLFFRWRLTRESWLSHSSLKGAASFRNQGGDFSSRENKSC